MHALASHIDTALDIIINVVSISIYFHGDRFIFVLC